MPEVAKETLQLAQALDVERFEELAHDAAVLREVLRYADSADDHRLTDSRPDGQSAVLAMRTALADAGLDAAGARPPGRAR